MEQPSDNAVTGEGDDFGIALPNNIAAWSEFMEQRFVRTVTSIAVRSKSVNGSAPAPPVYEAPGKSPTNKELYDRLGTYLTMVENGLEMTPQLRKACGRRIEKAIEVVTADPKFAFPAPVVDRVRHLKEKWDSENWGDNAEIKEEEISGSDSEPFSGSENIRRGSTTHLGSAHTGRPKMNTSKKSAGALRPAHPPPRNDPIWGVNGIMHGVKLKYASAKNKELDTRYPKRDSRIFGHNSLQVGAWYPSRIVALFDGAHGSSQGGIAGNEDEGARSIVVSGLYEDLDKDLGNTLYYSGSGSHENEDPQSPAPSTRGTRALHASLVTGNPVRVLRSANGKGKWSPTFGIRYDGLYQIIDADTPRNQKGGRYERFQLQRLPGQPELNDDYLSNHPDRQQIRDYHRINQGY